MVSILYRQQPATDSLKAESASNPGFRSPPESEFNHGSWTTGGSEAKNPGVVAEKVTGSMLSETNSASSSSTQSAYAPHNSPLSKQVEKSQIVFSRKLLDSFRHGNFLVSLFYEKKNLCLALYDVALDSELGKWTFCHQKRHFRCFADESLSVRVNYRPAVVEVTFSEVGKQGFIRRLFSGASGHNNSWSHYELGGDGAVRINRPGREFIVS